MSESYERRRAITADATSFGFFVIGFLARGAVGDADDRRYVEPASTEILTLTAWDGLDVAGVARLLSDRVVISPWACAAPFSARGAWVLA